MKVILLQDVAKMGKKFDVVDVADGYAFNYLIPRGIAEQALPKRIEELEKRKEEARAVEQEHIEKLTKELSGVKSNVVIEAKTNEKGKLFAGLEKSDLLNALKEQEGVDVEERFMVMEEPIKETGEHSIPFKVGDKSIDVTFSIKTSK